MIIQINYYPIGVVQTNEHMLFNRYYKLRNGMNTNTIIKKLKHVVTTMEEIYDRRYAWTYTVINPIDINGHNNKKV
jgi:hypothetical protein